MAVLISSAEITTKQQAIMSIHSVWFMLKYNPAAITANVASIWIFTCVSFLKPAINPVRAYSNAFIRAFRNFIGVWFRRDQDLVQFVNKK